MNEVDVRNVCSQVLAAPDYDSAWRAWEPLAAVDPQAVSPETYDAVAQAYFSMVYTKKRPSDTMALAEALGIDPKDPAVFIRTYAQASGADESELLSKLKESAYAYIVWMTGQELSPEDSRAIEQAGTGAEVQVVLAKYDRPSFSFLTMVNAGHFV